VIADRLSFRLGVEGAFNFGVRGAEIAGLLLDGEFGWEGATARARLRVERDVKDGCGLEAGLKGERDSNETSTLAETRATRRRCKGVDGAFGFVFGVRPCGARDTRGGDSAVTGVAGRLGEDDVDLAPALTSGVGEHCNAIAI
jgi:hypothetical protein